MTPPLLTMPMALTNSEVLTVFGQHEGRDDYTPRRAFPHLPQRLLDDDGSWRLFHDDTSVFYTGRRFSVGNEKDMLFLTVSPSHIPAKPEDPPDINNWEVAPALGRE